MNTENQPTLYLANAFSLSMLEGLEGFEHPTVHLKVMKLSTGTVIRLLQNPFKSAVGHEATAYFLSRLVGINIPFNREAIRLKKGDKLIVFQLLDRLPEGTTLTLVQLDKVRYNFYLVIVEGN